MTDGRLTLPRPRSAWVLTDGKVGDETQCLGITEALGIEAEVRHVAPRPAWAWAMPWGPIDPREREDHPASPLAPPYPDLVVASGRRAVPYLRRLKRIAGPRTFCVFLKDPRTGRGAADVLWVPRHDRLRGENVLATLTSPHRISRERLEAAGAQSFPAIDRLPGPRVAVLVGGDSRHHRFTPRATAVFLGLLSDLQTQGARLMATTSRRTPLPLRTGLAALTAGGSGYLWDGEGENPYVALLAKADALVVTADSVNMVGEAVATGRPVLTYEPQGGSRKISTFLDGLRAAGAVRPLSGRLEWFSYEPIDATPMIAQAILERYARRATDRSGLQEKIA